MDKHQIYIQILCALVTTTDSTPLTDASCDYFAARAWYITNAAWRHITGRE